MRTCDLVKKWKRIGLKPKQIELGKRALSFWKETFRLEKKMTGTFERLKYGREARGYRACAENFQRKFDLICMTAEFGKKWCKLCEGSKKIVASTGDKNHPLRLIPCHWCQ